LYNFVFKYDKNNHFESVRVLLAHIQNTIYEMRLLQIVDQKPYVKKLKQILKRWLGVETSWKVRICIREMESYCDEFLKDDYYCNYNPLVKIKTISLMIGWFYLDFSNNEKW